MPLTLFQKQLSKEITDAKLTTKVAFDRLETTNIQNENTVNLDKCTQRLSHFSKTPNNELTKEQKTDNTKSHNCLFKNRFN